MQYYCVYFVRDPPHISVNLFTDMLRVVGLYYNRTTAITLYI